MPSVSKAQQKLMRAAANDPKIARKRGISQKVAKEFVEKDKTTKNRRLPTRVKNKDSWNARKRSR